MKRNKILFLTLLGILIVSFLVVYLRLIYLPLNPSSTGEVVFRVEKGEGAKEIALNLEKNQLIRDALMFRFYVLFKGIAGYLKAGDYRLSPAMNIPQIAEKMFKGDIIKEKIAIIEGWNINDVAKELNSKLNADFKLTELKIADFQKEFSFLEDAPATASLEGFLFPDTYEIVSGTPLEEIVRKILSNFDKKLSSDLREEIKRQNKSIYEIVIMASLIEKEVRTKEDKELVSGILWKRLKAGMPLQIDATISYLTGKKTAKISIAETQIDSPCNTYKYPGLPIGPISNPGLESILAAIYPQESNYWFYLSTPDGKTIFSRTLEEHNLAKATYLK